MTDRPNLLFIMADQMRFDALGCHSQHGFTPNLDRLAAEGSDLRQHFANAPVCVPSRSTIFTGRHSHAHRVLENDARLAPHEAHLFKVLKEADYRLGYFGKNHLLPEPELAANCDARDECGRKSHATPEQAEYARLCGEAGERMRTIGAFAGAAFHDLPDEATGTGRIGDAAVGFLEASQDPRPWCAVASFHDPHAPHLAPRRFAQHHPADRIELPPWSSEELDTKPPRSRIKRQAQGSPRADDAARRHFLSVYRSMCSFVDEQVGRIVAAADRRGDASRTLVVFLSDHGDFCWQHGMCKKDLVLWDALLHVPCLFRWTGTLPAGRSPDTLTDHTDIVPSLLDLLGLETPQGVHGRSLAPLLRGETEDQKDVVFAEVCHPWMENPYPTFEAFHEAWQSAQASDQPHPLKWTAPFNVPGDYVKGVRTRDWKYTRLGSGFEELYDLAADPGERRNLAPAATGETLARLQEMRLLFLDQLMKSADPRSPKDDAALATHYPSWHHQT